MSEEDKDSSEKDLKKEREKLNNLGVTSTWHLLTDSKRKEKEE